MKAECDPLVAVHHQALSKTYSTHHHSSYSGITHFGDQEDVVSLGARVGYDRVNAPVFRRCDHLHQKVLCNRIDAGGIVLEEGTSRNGALVKATWAALLARLHVA